MSRLLTSTLVLCGALAIGASVIVVKTLQAGGEFTTIKDMGGEGCRQLSGITGAEDIAIDRTTGVAYVSATDRKAAQGGQAIRGEIRLLDMARPDDGFTAATAGVPEDFAPLGVSLWTSPEGEKRLFAVNRRRKGASSVEIFGVGEAGLRHLKTVTDPAIDSPNDVHAVGPESFYVTNNGTGGALARLTDYAFGRLRSNVVFHDGETARVVADGFGFANGVNASPDGETIYVADTFTRTLRFFTPDPASGALTETGSLIMGTGLDNIDVDETGALWIASHPKQFTMVAYAAGLFDRAPSQVIRAVPRPEGGGEVRTVLLDLGGRLSAASVAARYRDRYLVGSFIAPGMLVCPVPPAGG